MKRLNVKLLVSLIVIPAVLAVGIHFLHAYQIDRNAGTLKNQAEEAKKNGNTEDAIKQYTQYLKHRPEEIDAYRELANLVGDAADKPDATRNQVFRAVTVMEEAVRRHEGLSDVRRRLAEYFMKYGRFRDAIEHFDRIRVEEKGANLSSLDVKYAQCLIATSQEEKAVKLLSDVIGYDPTKQEFRADAVRGAAEIDAYVLLAEVYRKGADDSAEADVVINQLIKANPKSAKAFLERARFYQRQKKFELADKDLAKAVKLSPHDADVLLSAADIAANLKEFDRAQSFLETGMKENPDDERMYRALSSLAQMQRRFDQAMSYVEAGLKKKPDSQWLLVSRADLELQQNDLDGVRETIQKMRKGGFLPELIDLLESRVLVAEGKWVNATRSLERLRPLMARFPDQVQSIDIMLGQCYLSQSQPDKAADAFRRALDADPTSVPASLGFAQSQAQMGKNVAASDTIEKIRRGLGEREIPPAILNSFLQVELGKQLRLPKAERDWTDVDQLVAQIGKAPAENETKQAVQKAVLDAEILIYKDEREKARAELINAYKKFPKELTVYLALLNFVSQEKDPKPTPEAVLKVAEEKLGPVLQLRQARLSMAVRKENAVAKAEVAELDAKLKELPPNEQTAFLESLGNAYYRLRDYENARRCWSQVAAARPEDSKMLLTLFELSQEFGAEADMDATLDLVRKSAGSTSALFKFCEAEKTVWQVKQKKAEPGALDTARKQLEEARKLRPEWHEIARLSGEINEVDNKADEAIADFQRALELGPANPNIARRLVALLYLRGRFDEIDKAMNSLGPLQDADPLKKIAIETQFKGNSDEALADAAKVVAADPDNATNQLWYAQLLSRAGHDDEAQAAFRAAVDKDPKLTQAWLMLVNHLARNKQVVDAEAVIRQAKGKIPAESREAFLAQAYEIVGDQRQAEENYLALLEKRPKELGLMRGLATFYIRTNQSDKVSKQIEAMLAQPAASDPKASDSDKAHIAWARRAMAQNLANRGDYRSLQDAIKTLDANKTNGTTPVDDLMLAGSFWARRTELSSKLKAIKLMEQVQGLRQLSPDEQFSLAQLYEQTGDWSTARDSINNLLAKLETTPPGLATAFAQLLMRHDEISEAERYVIKVEEAQPNAPVAIELRARLLAKQDKTDQARDLLVKLLNDAPNENTRLSLLGGVATMLEEFKQLAATEELLRDAASKYPRAKLMLGTFVGKHGNLDECFALLEESRKSMPITTVIQVALGTLRQRSLEAGKQHYAKVEGWLKSALTEEPDSLNLNLQFAELRDIQGHTDEVIATYRKILQQKDLNPRNRAIVDNNLAFVLAVSGKDPAEGLRLIEEAINVLGPSSDLLDTRAMCYLAQGDAQRAVADLKTSITDSPSATKYTHLAQAELKAGNKAGAAAALKKARELKLDLNSLSALERKTYDQLVRELGSK